MKKPDILIFMSDQHSAGNNGFAGDPLVRTPNLDKIAESGTVFDNAYTSCPLCVPARSSFLTGQLPSKSGITTNFGCIPSDQATFIHSLAAEGYETVLCGRMHFLGEDQRHGFTNRLGGDTTPLYWGLTGELRTDLGIFKGTTGEGKCLNIIGKGNSPILEYDKMVIQEAMDYLDQEHEKPQCIVVGVYAPHFTYVAPEEDYDYYIDRVELPESLTKGTNYEHPAIAYRKKKADEKTILAARAAYFGLITNLDRQIGQVREAYGQYLNRENREGIFIYMSDHGDQVGDRNIFAKNTFFESSARIPMIIEGNGICSNSRIENPVSIMDIGPTLCDMVGAILPPQQDGQSLMKQLKESTEDQERCVISELTEAKKKNYPNVDHEVIPARMIRKGNYKLISYYGYEEHDLLFDLENDPNELNNIIIEQDEKYHEMLELLNKDYNPAELVATYRRNMEHHKILFKWGRSVIPTQDEHWSPSLEDISYIQTIN